MSKKQSIITRLLEDKSASPPAVADVEAAIAEANQRSKEVQERIADIEPGSIINSGGTSTRSRIMTEGEPGDLVALDRELDELKAERQQLEHRSELLRKKLDEAKRAEAIAALPSLRKALPDQCARLEKARAAAAEAERKFRDEVGKYTDAVQASGVEDDYSLQPLATRVCDLLGFDESGPGKYSGARANWFKRLGAGLTVKAAAALGVEHPDAEPTEGWEGEPPARRRRSDYWDRNPA